jgi:hypothetical protein
MLCEHSSEENFNKFILHEKLQNDLKNLKRFSFKVLQLFQGKQKINFEETLRKIESNIHASPIKRSFSENHSGKLSALF